MEVFIVTLEDELAEQKCEICGEKEPVSRIVICDHCALAYHLECVGLDRIPMGNWYCDLCYLMLEDLNLLDSTELDPVENKALIEFL